MAGRQVADLAAEDQEGALVAEILAAARARRAPAAGRNEAQRDVVARLEHSDSWADLDDLARALVTADHRQRGRAGLLDDRGRDRDVAGDQVLVGMAQAR